MALLTGQIIHNDIALTGTLELSNAESITKVEVLNGYFAEIGLPPGNYQALLISRNPDGTVPELTIEVPYGERVTWQELSASAIPYKQSLPPDPVPREGSTEPPDYWEKEESIQLSFEPVEEVIPAPTQIDRRTQLLIEMQRRLRRK